jgi:hypothetical protein
LTNTAAAKGAEAFEAAARAVEKDVAKGWARAGTGGLPAALAVGRLGIALLVGVALAARMAGLAPGVLDGAVAVGQMAVARAARQAL